MRELLLSLLMFIVVSMNAQEWITTGSEYQDSYFISCCEVNDKGNYLVGHSNNKAEEPQCKAYIAFVDNDGVWTESVLDCDTSASFTSCKFLPDGNLFVTGVKRTQNTPLMKDYKVFFVAIYDTDLNVKTVRNYSLFDSFISFEDVECRITCNDRNVAVATIMCDSLAPVGQFYHVNLFMEFDYEGNMLRKNVVRGFNKAHYINEFCYLEKQGEYLYHGNNFRNDGYYSTCYFDKDFNLKRAYDLDLPFVSTRKIGYWCDDSKYISVCNHHLTGQNFYTQAAVLIDTMSVIHKSYFFIREDTISCLAGNNCIEHLNDSTIFVAMSNLYEDRFNEVPVTVIYQVDSALNLRASNWFYLPSHFGRASYISKTPDNKCVVVGYAINEDKKSIPFAIKFSDKDMQPILNIGKVETAPYEMIISPNPAETTVRIVLTGKDFEEGELIAYTLDGKMVCRTAISSFDDNIIDVAGWSSGAYLFVVKQRDIISQKIFIKN